MDRLRSAWRATTSVIATMFVVVFLAAVAIENLGYFLRSPLPLRPEAHDFLAVLGADQYWKMFGAHFPRHVRVPVVQVVLLGGRRVFLPAAVSPGFSPELSRRFELDGLSDEARRVTWGSNFGTARIEKFESRAASPNDHWLGVRTALTAARVRRWAEQKPRLAKRVRSVDLLSVAVASPRDGNPATVLSVDPVSIAPALLSDWPVPATRSAFGARP